MFALQVVIHTLPTALVGHVLYRMTTYGYPTPKGIFLLYLFSSFVSWTLVGTFSTRILRGCHGAGAVCALAIPFFAAFLWQCEQNGIHTSAIGLLAPAGLALMFAAIPALIVQSIIAPYLVDSLYLRRRLGVRDIREQDPSAIDPEPLGLLILCHAVPTIAITYGNGFFESANNGREFLVVMLVTFLSSALWVTTLRKYLWDINLQTRLIAGGMCGQLVPAFAIAAYWSLHFGADSSSAVHAAVLNASSTALVTIPIQALISVWAGRNRRAFSFQCAQAPNALKPNA
ncbi:hypothetical protein [Fimbriimonas ginsengisoli]|uniref:Uncharacterized protein n=1 Tax=Fimbriimonas ginsengisoli Gsoil 348 TaxID=661478 RepID=A0A068NMA7_FIMGI|nr:hypothetical protein [Fimbriimonas ginsengisoli]AIE83920.1 hypothetical protein OP10G_0552 [Fimbriimonas ginsengisoli Gsoil 348]